MDAQTKRLERRVVWKVVKKSLIYFGIAIGLMMPFFLLPDSGDTPQWLFIPSVILGLIGVGMVLFHWAPILLFMSGLADGLEEENEVLQKEVEQQQRLQQRYEDRTRIPTRLL